MKDLRIFSFGGGTQSVAVLLLNIVHVLQYDAFVFANVGADSENPDTLDYIDTHIKPLCIKHNIAFVTVQATRKGKPDTLLAAIYRDNRSIPIPARMSNGAPGNRSCTQDFKIAVIDRHIRSMGCERAVIGLGISVDEFTRIRDTDWHDTMYGKPLGFWKLREYPLIELGYSRNKCEMVILNAGLPLPPKSSCWFCPFHTRNSWIELKRLRPDLFEKAVAVEEQINRKRGTLGKDRLYLHSSATSLVRAVGNQLALPLWNNDEGCDGYCDV